MNEPKYKVGDIVRLEVDTRDLRTGDIAKITNASQDGKPYFIEGIIDSQKYYCDWVEESWIEYVEVLKPISKSNDDLIKELKKVIDYVNLLITNQEAKK